MYARKVDLNHALIRGALRQMGCSVRDVFMVGKDYPDLHVGVCGIDQLVEVKSDGGALSTGQEKFHRDWRGAKPRVIRTVKEAALLVADMGQRARRKA
jgi:hypothetical protein